MMPSIFHEESDAAWQQAIVQDVILVVQEVLTTEKTCRIALAGGSTPEGIYKTMAKLDLDWPRLHFTVMDERYVPSDHAESNLKMIRKALLNHIPLSPDQVLAFDTSLPYIDAAKEMERQLLQLKNKREPLFDLLILGAGSDGHVASLFQPSDLDASLARCTQAPSTYETHQRLSLGLGALSQAKQAMLLLRGPSKKPVLDSLQSPSQSTPIEVLVQRVPTKVHACV